MKKLYTLLLLAFCIGFVGCSDDDENNNVSQLRVVSSEVSFTCTGGTGSIVFSSPVAVTATSSEEWCQVEVTGQTANVTVDANLDLGSRSAVITLSTPNEKTQVPVYQLGDILDTDFNSCSFFGDGGEVSFNVKSNWEIELNGIDESWLSYTMTDGRLTISCLPLEGIGYRACEVELVSGAHHVKALLSQVNLVGTFSCYVNSGNTAYGTCSIEKSNVSGRFVVTPTGSAYDAPYYITYREGYVVINFGQVLGPYPDDTSENIVLCAYDSVNGRLSWNAGIEYVAPIAFDADGHMVLQFMDNGTWSGYTVNGFYYSITSNGSPTGTGWAAITNLVWVSR